MLRARTITTLVALTGALTIPGTAVAQDQLSPDARDAATGYSASIAARPDPRSPDTRDAATGYRPSVAVDLRSPDTRDAAQHVSPAQQFRVVPVVSKSSGGFEWGDAGIGAAGMLAIVLAVSGFGVLAAHRRRERIPFAH